MNSKRKRSKKNPSKYNQRPRFLYSNTAIVLFLLAIVFLSYRLINFVPKRNLSEAKLENSLAELERYEKEEAELRRKIEELETPEGKERTVRERFNVAKENEGIIYVIEDEGLGSGLMINSANPEEAQKEKPSFFERIRDWISF